MPIWNLFHSSKIPEEIHNWTIRSTTRALGRRLYEPKLTPRGRELIEEELSWRIELMRQIGGCDPHEIFLYNSKGFKSFTSEYEDILQIDLLGRPSRPGSRFLDYTRTMLEREAKESGTRRRILDEVKGTRRADERAHERMEEDCRRMLRDFERQERIALEQEEEEAYAREMRVRDERERKALKREEDPYLRGLDNQAREAQEKGVRDYRPSRDSKRSLPATGRRVSDAGYRTKQRGRPNTYDGGFDALGSDHWSRPPNGPSRGKEPIRPKMEQGSHNGRTSAPSRQSEGSNRPPKRPQTQTAATQTDWKIPNGRKQSRPPKAHHILQKCLPNLLPKLDQLGETSGHLFHLHKARYVTRLDGLGSGTRSFGERLWESWRDMQSTRVFLEGIS